MRFWDFLMTALRETVADDMEAMMQPEPSGDFIVISPKVLDKLTVQERIFLMDLRRKVKRITAREYPGQWFQIILRLGRNRGHDK